MCGRPDLEAPRGAGRLEERQPAGGARARQSSSEFLSVGLHSAPDPSWSASVMEMEALLIGYEYKPNMIKRVGMIG